MDLASCVPICYLFHSQRRDLWVTFFLVNYTILVVDFVELEEFNDARYDDKYDNTRLYYMERAFLRYGR